MARAVSLFSTRTITPNGLHQVMTFLGGERNERGWRIERKGRSVFVELGTDDILDFPDDIIREVADELEGIPESRVVLIFDDSNKDRLEYQMARAVGIAMAEHWPIVLHDHAELVETLYAPGERPSQN